MALSVFMGRGGVAKHDILEEMHRFYPTFDEPRLGMNLFNETCQGTLPICLGIIERANSFEEAIRYAIAVGGDSDTIGAIVGAIAEAIWGVPEEIVRTASPIYHTIYAGCTMTFARRLRGCENSIYAQGAKGGTVICTKRCTDDRLFLVYICACKIVYIIYRII